MLALTTFIVKAFSYQFLESMSCPGIVVLPRVLLLFLRRPRSTRPPGVAARNRRASANHKQFASPGYFRIARDSGRIALIRLLYAGVSVDLRGGLLVSQGDHRIDAYGAAGGQVGRDECDDNERENGESERRRIIGSEAEEKLLHEARNPDGAKQSR